MQMLCLCPCFPGNSFHCGSAPRPTGNQGQRALCTSHKLPFITSDSSPHQEAPWCRGEQLKQESGSDSPVTRSRSAPTTTSCSSAEKRRFPEVDLTSNMRPCALNPLDPADMQQRRNVQPQRLRGRKPRLQLKDHQGPTLKRSFGTSPGFLGWFPD